MKRGNYFLTAVSCLSLMVIIINSILESCMNPHMSNWVVPIALCGVYTIGHIMVTIYRLLGQLE